MFAPALTVSGILKLFFCLKDEVQVIWCKFRNGIICWQISKSVKIVRPIFALSFTVSEILKFLIFNRQNVGQGH